MNVQPVLLSMCCLWLVAAGCTSKQPLSVGLVVDYFDYSEHYRPTAVLVGDGKLYASLGSQWGHDGWWVEQDWRYRNAQARDRGRFDWFMGTDQVPVQVNIFNRRPDAPAWFGPHISEQDYRHPLTGFLSCTLTFYNTKGEVCTQRFVWSVVEGVVQEPALIPIDFDAGPAR